MNAGQIKVRIFIIQLIDWTLLLGVFGMGGYAILYAENPERYGVIALVGLWLLHMLGKYSVTKISRYKMELEKIQRKKH